MKTLRHVRGLLHRFKRQGRSKATPACRASLLGTLLIGKQSDTSQVYLFWHLRGNLCDYLQDIDVNDVQRIFKASMSAPVFDSQAYSPVPDKAVFQLNRSTSSWQHPKQEESAERKPLFDAGLALIAEVGPLYYLECFLDLIPLRRLRSSIPEGIKAHFGMYVNRIVKYSLTNHSVEAPVQNTECSRSMVDRCCKYCRSKSCSI